MKSGGRAGRAHGWVDISLLGRNTATCPAKGVGRERVTGSVRMAIAVEWLECRLNGEG